MDNLEANIMDKSMRSVFVGNIPYEATEEKLKDVFAEVGQVLSFKLVFDRETGKPKGYGFCEYRDQETALSAMRNLNGYEIGGRFLRVDNACTEKSRMEMQNLLNQPPVENPYGEPTSAEKAPEAISKAVATLPPEQMFELMKQMKLCIQNNPAEARQMLLQNPQLAYALLQAQVVMKIIDPQTACTMLHQQNVVPEVLIPKERTHLSQVPIRTAFINSLQPVPPPHVPNVNAHNASLNHNMTAPPNFIPNQDIDLRSIDMRPQTDPRISRMPDQDMRTMTSASSNDNFPRDKRAPPLNAPSFSVNDHRSVPPPLIQPPRSDPRQKINMSNPGPGPQAQPARIPMSNAPPSQATSRPPMNPPSATNVINSAGASDQEKAALIMQVLQLSDEQISMLPPEQRNSILVLKEQIAKSAHR